MRDVSDNVKHLLLGLLLAGVSVFGIAQCKTCMDYSKDGEARCIDAGGNPCLCCEHFKPPEGFTCENTCRGEAIKQVERDKASAAE